MIHLLRPLYNFISKWDRAKKISNPAYILFLLTLRLLWLTLNPNRKQLVEEKILLASTFRSQRITEGETRGRNWSRNPEECCLLACSLPGLQLAFLYKPGPFSWGIVSHSGLGFPVSINNQDCPHRHGNKPIWLGKSLNLGSYFLGDSRLCRL